MPRLLIYAIVFIEGFSSLGAEIIALRRLVPHVGSSIVVTAPTIGFFLLALALGYASGAKVAADYRAIVARNFLIAAALAGLATDGGLYVPEHWPTLAARRPGMTYAQRAAQVMAPFVGEDVPDLGALCEEAYATFAHPAVAPLTQLDARHFLMELFHGPTLAFKDVALQLVGRLFDTVLGQRGQRVTIVGATSGDTGSAAIDGVKGCANVDIVILYPYGRTSEVQRRQMTTVDSPNVRVVAIDGTRVTLRLVGGDTLTLDLP